MKNFLLLVTSMLLLLAPAAVAVAGNNDLIWDATNSVNGIVLTAKYKESPDNGLIDQSLEVQLDNAPANTTVTITVVGTVLGTMTTDAFGTANARFERLGLPMDAAGRPAAPRLDTGDSIRVSDGNQGMSATFVPRP
jgi:opacity protein-like surface antigen